MIWSKMIDSNAMHVRTSKFDYLVKYIPRDKGIRQ